jgi:hypothetical protein
MEFFVSKTTTSQAQNEAAETIQKMMDEQVERMESQQKDYTRMESQAYAQLSKNIDEAARLFKDGIAYNSQLSAEWRKLSLETMRRSAAMFSGSWAA